MTTPESVEPRNRDFSNQDLRDQPIPNINLIGANFRETILKRCDFSEHDLSFADFTNSDLYSANFSGANLYATVFRGADLTRADFCNAKLYGIKLFDVDVTRARFDRIVHEERTARTHSDFDKASEVYNALKRAFKDQGEIGIAAHYYYRQRVCQRRAKPNRIAALLDLIFLDWLIGYGEHPIRSVYWSIFLIVSFALIHISLPHFSAGGVFYTFDGERVLSSIWDLPLLLGVSVTAFVGADMSGWRLTGLSRWLISPETLLGTIMLSIILIGFSRKIVRD
jgi:hypothetical protein